MKVTKLNGLSRCDRDLLLGTCVTWGSLFIALIGVICFALTQETQSTAEAAALVADNRAIVGDSDGKS